MNWVIFQYFKKINIVQKSMFVFSVSRYNVLVFSKLCLIECYLISRAPVKRNIAYSSFILQKTCFISHKFSFFENFLSHRTPLILFFNNRRVSTYWQQYIFHCRKGFRGQSSNRKKTEWDSSQLTPYSILNSCGIMA